MYMQRIGRDLDFPRNVSDLDRLDLESRRVNEKEMMIIWMILASNQRNDSYRFWDKHFLLPNTPLHFPYIASVSNLDIIVASNIICKFLTVIYTTAMASTIKSSTEWKVKELAVDSWGLSLWLVNLWYPRFLHKFLYRFVAFVFLFSARKWISSYLII